MEQLIEKSFKDLEGMTDVIANRFFLARRIHALKHEDCLAEFDYGDGTNYDQYLEKVSRAFESLSEGERNLINHEFFFQSYHNWWESIYSKATFYRYKRKAMMKFLGAFYNE